MASGNEIVSIQNTSNQPVCPVDTKPIPVLSWLSMKARMAGTACFAAIAKPATGPALLACVCLAAIAYNKRKCTPCQSTNTAPKPAKHRPLLHRSMSIAALHGGKMTLERLLDAQKARIDVEGLDLEVNEMKKLLSEQHISFKELHRSATKLEMSGREDVAIRMLTKAHEDAQKNKHSLEAYELEMILVEMLIYKGDHERALQCKCLTESSISDVRIPLYKAIIYTMKKDKTYAQTYYKEFQKIRRTLQSPDEIEEGSALCKIVLQFAEFEHVVENLRKEIEHAHKIKDK